MTIFQITLVITIIFMGNFLASLERKSPKLFWGLILMLMLIFTSFDKDSLIYNHNTSPSYTEQTISNIRSGSEPTNPKPGFIGSRTGQGNALTGPKSADTGQGTNTESTPGNDKGWPGPSFPWGADPKYSRSGSCDGSGPHQLSAAKNWISDPSAWEDDERDHPLIVPVDFPYKLNDKNEPTLLVPNLGNTKFEGVGKFIRVEFQQTATHIHHAPEFGISLPDNFDMQFYLNLSRSGKIAYATKMLPRSTIISYQNEIAKRLTPVFNPNTYSREGIAGQQKVPTQLIIEKPRDSYSLSGQKTQTSVPSASGKKDIMLGIISDDNLHISSFPITQARLDRLEAENYWVLKNQNIQ
jgi:hypothetical protein